MVLGLYAGAFAETRFDKHMENFCSNKERMIKSVLEWSFQKVVLNYLIVNNKLVLVPEKIKSTVDCIMER
ncbi:hypothetical protein G9A89_003258 [Geosiphon pyriformis]|nr:hypothetical protein G9A89_003258 [Geosiphon pyriformis]